MDLEGRKYVFKSLVGSHNYNLNTKESDKDYKMFILPLFEDLYFNKTFQKSYIGELEDVDIQDIRNCSKLWYKSNINYMEVLFSEDLEINEELDDKSKEIVSELIKMREDIARMNLKYLYDACVGMHRNKMKLLEKGTSGTKHLVQAYGYDTKQGLHAYRVLDFIERYADNSFKDFKGAIWYSDEEQGRKYLLDLKNGALTLGAFKEMAKEKLENTEKRFKEVYYSKETNEEINKKVIDLIKELVKNNF